MNKKFYDILDNLSGASADAGDKVEQYAEDQSDAAQEQAKNLTDNMTDLQKYETAKQDNPARVAEADAKALEALSKIQVA